MEIQWIILARGCNINQDRTVDIWGIGHHFTIPNPTDRVSVHLIAKLNFQPTETGELKMISLRIEHVERKEIVERFDNMPYRIPDLPTWANSQTYWDLALNDITLPYSGDYTFTLYAEGEYKNHETVGVTHIGG